MTGKASDAPWWLEAGPETCAGCEVAMHLEWTIHCAVCDRPFCSLCVVTAKAECEYVCKDCWTSP